MNFNEWLQSRLTAHRYSPGPIDGVFGPKTEKALKRFQKSNGIEVTGRADEATVKGLRASSSAITPLDMSLIPDRNTDPEKPINPATPKNINPSDLGLQYNEWPRQNSVPDYYGAVGQHQTHITPPFQMYLAWDTDTSVSRITVHKKVAASAQRVFNAIPKVYSAKEIDDLGLNLFAGSLNVRKMRGGSRYSMHSWGIAIDFDSARNPFRADYPDARLSHQDAEPFWELWEAEGWISLGRSAGYDWMHCQAARV